MAKRRQEDTPEPEPADEEYYEEEEVLPEEQQMDQKNRWILVLTSSYGISALIHIGVLIIASLLYYGGGGKVIEKVAAILPKLEKKEQEYDPTKKRDLHKRPEIKQEQKIDKPIKKLEEEVEEVKENEIPKGTSLSNLANKNLESTSVVDAFGVGGGAAGAYGQRWGKGSLTREGGSDATESAVLAALYWLARHQDEDGKWDCDEFHKNCGKYCERTRREDKTTGETVCDCPCLKCEGKQHSGCQMNNRCDGPDFRAGGGRGPGAGDKRYDEGVTALALLAFLGNGHTHRHSTYPEFKRAVKKGLDYLKGRQRDDGSVGFDGGETIYNHAIATMALCEAYAISRDFTLKKYAQKAVDFSIQAQNPGLGWKYGVKVGKNDTSVTGWFVLALKAAKTAELEVPDAAFQGALSWFEKATSDGGPNAAPGLVGYERPGDGGSQINRKSLDHPDVYPKYEAVPTMTGVAVICRIFTGQKKTEERVKQGVKILMDNVPTFDETKEKNKTNFYYWYYATYGIFQATSYNSPEWGKWNKAMQVAILGPDDRGDDPRKNRQRMIESGDADGSWDPVDEWGIAGGRVYSTAINVLTLEIYYRYERAQQ